MNYPENVARLQNILEMDDRSLQQNRRGFKFEELLAGSENACPRQGGSRLRSTREKGYQKCEMLILAGLGSSTLTSRMCQYINVLIDEYRLRTTPKKKPVIGLDDLYLLLYTHWVLDDSTFKDERQRVQVATGLLTAAFLGCRPCSLFLRSKRTFTPQDSESVGTFMPAWFRQHESRKVSRHVVS